MSVLVAAALLAVVGAAPILDSEAATRRTAPTQERAPAAHLVVALGDSVPSGAACPCSPFPSLYGALLGQRTGGPVKVENFAVSGLDTAGLLAQFRQARVVESVRRADVLLVTIGANDFEDNHDQVVEGACTRQAADCVSDEMGSMRANLAKALAEIGTLRQGRPTTVLVTGYWNVFEDGYVAQQASGASGLKASIRLTLRVNAAISAVASTSGAHYVDLFEPFQSRGGHISSLLAADGDHPDTAGHQLIAKTLLAASLPRMP
ncbi:MAG: hypothetical protein JWR90_1777 [Marmoricola sp.]|jgi:lysophospholipase L1-like esterase|nr:hypothetical protein [Marmoricola sp.]